MWLIDACKDYLSFQKNFKRWDDFEFGAPLEKKNMKIELQDA